MEIMTNFVVHVFMSLTVRENVPLSLIPQTSSIQDLSPYFSESIVPLVKWA